MPNLRFLPCLLSLLLCLPAFAQPQTKAQPKTQAKPQNVQFLSPKLSLLEPLHAFLDTLEKAFGTAELSERMEKLGLHLLLLPMTQSTWTQKGLALEKPFVAQFQPGLFVCMGVADSKVLVSTVDAFPGEEKTTQKGTLNYRVFRTSPLHGFVLFWNAGLLCSRPHTPSLTATALPNELEKTLAEASALSKTTAKQNWPLLLGKDIQLQAEPVSAKRLKLRMHTTNPFWKLKATREGKTALASVSADTGLVLKSSGIPAQEFFKNTDFIARLSPGNDPLLPQKQAWFSRLSPLLADEFLAKTSFPHGRDTETLLLVAKLKAGSESAFDLWLSQMPKNDSYVGASSLPTQRGPLTLARKGSWVFASTHPELALLQIEQLEKAKPEAMPLIVGMAVPKTLEAILQGETFAGLAMGLDSKQMRVLRFNAPLRQLIHTFGFIQVEARSKPNNAAEILWDIALTP